MVTDSHRVRWGVALAMMMMLAIGPGRVVAGPTPAQKCAAAKLKAAGRAVQSVAKCDADGPGDGSCAAKAYAKAATAFGKADTKGGCATPGNLPMVQAVMDRCRDAFTHNVGFQGVPGPDCLGDKMKASGKAAFAKAQCRRKAILNGAAVDGKCLAKADAKLAAALAKADLKGPCFPGTGITQLIDGCVDQLQTGPSPTGCFDRTREGLGAFGGIAACAGTPPVSYVFGTSEGFCAPGWRVCRFDDAAVHTVTYADATAFGGCYGYNAADNFGACLACSVGTPVNQSGIGSDCGYGGAGLTSCLAAGRVTVTPFSSLLGCGVGAAYSTTGVVCCATGIPNTTTTTTTQPGGTTSTSTTTSTTTTMPPLTCCNVSVDEWSSGVPIQHYTDGCFMDVDTVLCNTMHPPASCNGANCLSGTPAAGVCNGATGFCEPVVTGPSACCDTGGSGCLEGADTFINAVVCSEANGGSFFHFNSGLHCLPDGSGSPGSLSCQ